MANYHRAPDSEREKFRRYLEKGGVIDSLKSVLVTLFEYQEKPNNALEFIKQHLDTTGYASADAESLEQEVAELRQKCALLTEENKELQAKLHYCESESEDGA